MKYPYFSFYPIDYLNNIKVKQLTHEQRGIYFDILCHMWLMDDCMLPDDDQFISRLLHVRPSKWRKLKEILSTGNSNVLMIHDGKIYNMRLLAEREKVKKISSSASANANARWGNNKDN